jgi:hypothetical protein
VKRVALVVVALAGCGDLKGFSGPVPPLTTYTVVPPAMADSSPHHLQVAIVWGMQWLPEALCVLGSMGQQSVLDAGCRDSFGFVPLVAEPGIDVSPGVPVDLDFQTLPGAEVLVGQLTGRVGYASIVFYDDLDDSGTLQLARPNRLGLPMDGPGSEPGGVQLPDLVLGATFVTMTLPDTRVSYVEGSFDEAAAFYPRAGCGAPPDGFSVLRASGFDKASAATYVAAGQLPPEIDPSQCVEALPQDQPITAFASRSDYPDLNEVACTENNDDSSVRYRDPADQPDDVSERMSACVPLPTFPGQNPGPQQIELIITGRSDDACKGLTHYVLKGCREDPNCSDPDWDHSASPPPWWPCPTS